MSFTPFIQSDPFRFYGMGDADMASAPFMPVFTIRYWLIAGNPCTLYRGIRPVRHALLLPILSLPWQNNPGHKAFPLRAVAKQQLPVIEQRHIPGNGQPESDSSREPVA